MSIQLNARNVRNIGIAATVLVLALFLLRGFHAISLQQPLYIMAGGFEEESLFAIWKFIRGDSVYTDPYSIPFAAAYFNWMFYGVYGEIIGLVQSALGLTDAWISTIGRLVTLMGTGVGLLVSYRLFSFFLKGEPDAKIFALIFAILIFIGPLAGFWVFTVRPDMWAPTLDALAIHCFFKFKNRHELTALLLFCLFSYFSWAFKQTHILAPATIGLYLLSLGQWRNLFIVCFSMFVLWGGTLLLGSESYVRMLSLGVSGAAFSFDVWLKAFINFVIKSIPLILLFITILGWGFNRESRTVMLAHSGFRFALCGVIAWLLVVFPASAKIGAAENYHLEGSLYLALAGVTGYAALGDRLQNSKLFNAIHGLGWALLVIALIAALSGNAKISLQDQHERLLAYKACMASLAQPIFVENRYAALPWLKPGEPHFILAYNYEADRRAGKKFEKNGIGGLIENGYFGALVLSRRTGDYFDGVSLAGYIRQPTLCAKKAIYIRK
jgi:hypothetical protein